MHQHFTSNKKLGRVASQRKALLKSLAVSIIFHERIKTTKAKAKFAKSFIEKLITVGKQGDLAARRLLIKKIADEHAVAKIIEDLSPRFKNRPGGYLRIINLENRFGDNAPMVFLEFVKEAKKEDIAKEPTTETPLKKTEQKEKTKKSELNKESDTKKTPQKAKNNKENKKTK